MAVARIMQYRIREIRDSGFSEAGYLPVQTQSSHNRIEAPPDGSRFDPKQMPGQGPGSEVGSMPTSGDAAVDKIRQGWQNVVHDTQMLMIQAQDPAMKEHFQALLDVMKQTLEALGISEGGNTPSGSPSPGPSNPQPANEPTTPDEGANPGQAINVDGGGRVSYTFTNNSSEAKQVGFMQDPTKPMAVSGTLQPGESATFSVPDGVSGYFAVADSNGQFQPSASRFEIFSENDKANVNVSYITGRNAAFLVGDQLGNTIGDNLAIAGSASQGILSFDSAGNPTITGWYDGSTPEMQAGGAYMEQALGGTGGAYIHPLDDRREVGQNPMTMAQNPSTQFAISIGDA